MRPAQALRVCGAVALLAGLAAASRRAPAPFVINETPSVPRGVYQRVAEAPGVGRFVILVPPPSGAAYLNAQGAPSGARLLKQVAAGAGERVCVEGGRLSWPRGAAAALPQDRLGRRLPSWRGCRVLGADELLVLGDSPSSFDSRYFGPVRVAAIHGVYRKVWTW